MLNWIGTGASIIGAFLVAFGLFISGYIAFFAGALCWLVIGFRVQDRALIVLNALYLTSNVVGLIRNF